MTKCSLGILVSGSGSNLQAILEACRSDDYPAHVSLVLCNVPGVKAIERAKNFNIPTHVISHQDFPNREAFEKQLVEKLEEAKVDYVILAGFMRLLSPFFIRRFPSRILNIHPSLLPEFPGTHAIERAFTAKIPQTGVTVHFVDEGTDTGPILLQEKVPIAKEDTLESLEEKIHRVEHKLYPQAIRIVSEKLLGKSEKFL